jgi:cytochrome c oxidase subunit 2
MRRALYGIIFAVMSAQAVGAEAPQPPSSDAIASAWIGACLSCHGEQAQGIAAKFAPALAGQDPQYLHRQLAHYRDGLRGTDDNISRQMGLIAAALGDNDAVLELLAERLSAYVPSRLSDPEEPVPIEFASCQSCHAGAIKGGDLTVPAIYGLDYDYLLRQLILYRDGGRGDHPADAGGQLMAATVAGKSDAELAMIATFFSGRQTDTSR